MSFTGLMYRFISHSYSVSTIHLLIFFILFFRLLFVLQFFSVFSYKFNFYRRLFECGAQWRSSFLVWDFFCFCSSVSWCVISHFILLLHIIVSFILLPHIEFTLLSFTQWTHQYSKIQEIFLCFMFLLLLFSLRLQIFYVLQSIFSHQ